MHLKVYAFFNLFALKLGLNNYKVYFLHYVVLELQLFLLLLYRPSSQRHGSTTVSENEEISRS